MKAVVIAGRAYTAVEYVERTLFDVAAELGGKDVFLSFVGDLEITAKEARDLALWRAVRQNVVAAAGETLCAAAFIIGGLLLSSDALHLNLSAMSISVMMCLVSLVLVAYLVHQVSRVRKWFVGDLMRLVTIEDRSTAAESAVTISKAFYHKLIWQLAVPGMICYPFTMFAFLLGTGAPTAAHLVLLPLTTIVGVIVNCLYLVRLYHSDLLSWYSLEGIAFSREQQL